MKKILFIAALVLLFASCAEKRTPDQMLDNIVKARNGSELTCAERKLAVRIADVVPEMVGIEDGRFVMLGDEQFLTERELPVGLIKVLNKEIALLNTLMSKEEVENNANLMNESAEAMRKLGKRR